MKQSLRRNAVKKPQQAFGWNFDTPEEHLAACNAIEAAVVRLRKADGELRVAEVAS